MTEGFPVRKSGFFQQPAASFCAGTLAGAKPKIVDNLARGRFRRLRFGIQLQAVVPRHWRETVAAEIPHQDFGDVSLRRSTWSVATAAPPHQMSC
jgi:hypothetical protein